MIEAEPDEQFMTRLRLEIESEKWEGKAVDRLARISFYLGLVEEHPWCMSFFLATGVLTQRDVDEYSASKE